MSIDDHEFPHLVPHLSFSQKLEKAIMEGFFQTLPRPSSPLPPLPSSSHCPQFGIPFHDLLHAF